MSSVFVFTLFCVLYSSCSDYRESSGCLSLLIAFSQGLTEAEIGQADGQFFQPLLRFVEQVRLLQVK